jgi:hypothetical protein
VIRIWDSARLPNPLGHLRFLPVEELLQGPSDADPIETKRDLLGVFEHYVVVEGGCIAL